MKPMRICLSALMLFGWMPSAVNGSTDEEVRADWACPDRTLDGGFAVSVVRRHDHSRPLGAAKPGLAVSGRRVTISSMPLSGLISMAYGVAPYRIIGGPPWAYSSLDWAYDILATADGQGVLTVNEVRPMLRSLLEERFSLRTRCETRQIRVYALVVGKGEPKMKQSGNETPFTSTTRPQLGGGKEGLELVATAETMAQLAGQLGVYAGLPVIDKTGLDARYEFTLKWNPETAGRPSSDDGPLDASGPTIFGALSEQLGLRLVRESNRMAVLVIVSAVQPGLDQ